jgi:cyclopropane fatty-acyl-phospholipid synthase-like methyltransferase
VPGLIERLEEGIDVLDVGCGSGRAMNLLAHTFPNSSFVGYDFSEEAIARARAEAKEHATANVRFEVKYAASLDEEERYDLITTFDAVHDQADPAAVLKGISGALREEGVYLMQDIAGSSHHHNNLERPIGPLLYTVSTMHCMTVSLAQGGEGLGAMWGGEKAKQMLEEAGFKEVEINSSPTTL